jgi:hypothetical protein
MDDKYVIERRKILNKSRKDFKGVRQLPIYKESKIRKIINFILKPLR